MQPQLRVTGLDDRVDIGVVQVILPHLFAEQQADGKALAKIQPRQFAEIHAALQSICRGGQHLILRRLTDAGIGFHIFRLVSEHPLSADHIHDAAVLDLDICDLAVDLLVGSQHLVHSLNAGHIAGFQRDRFSTSGDVSNIDDCEDGLCPAAIGKTQGVVCIRLRQDLIAALGQRA